MSRVSWGHKITVGWLLVGWLSMATAWAQLPLAKLNTVFPLGGAAGSIVEVAVSGSDLDEADGLIFSDPRVNSLKTGSTFVFGVAMGCPIRGPLQ